MMAEVPGAWAAAQQAVNGGDLGRDFVLHALRHFERQHLLADGLGEACGGFAGRRGQANAQRAAGLYGGRLQQRQQAHHGGGLAGAGATGDDAEGTSGGQGAGEFLPVDHTLGRRLVKQAVQALGQVGGNGFLGSQAQGGVDASLVGPVAAQVQTLAGQHQRTAFCGVAAVDCQGNQRAGHQGMAPVGAVQPVEQLRGQQHGAGLQVAFRRQGQGKVRRLEGFEQVEAHMAMAQLVTGQGRRQ